MQNLYDFLIRDLYLSYSYYLFKLFLSSDIILLTFISVTLFFSFRYFYKQGFSILYFIKLIFIIIFILIFLLIPFYKGKIMNYYFTNGYFFINLINDYKIMNGSFPNNLNELIPDSMEKSEFDYKKDGLQYEFYGKDELNHRFKTDYYQNDYFNLKLKIPNFNSPVYRYNEQKKRFLSDF